MKTLFVRKSFIISLSILIAAAIALGTLAGFVSGSQSALNPDMPTIVVDAGHGGIDNGVTGVITGNDEADINLAISRYLKGQFTSAGFNCVMTRTTQSGLYGNTSSGFKKRDMEARKKVITDCDADMVISVHQNFCPLPSRRGGTVFFDKSSASSASLAASIQNELNSMDKCGSKNSALFGDYYMLKCTDSPSVIVECGFMSNTEDDKLLADEEFQRAIAYAIFKGAVGYLSGLK